jgi:hypothetical protein
MTPSDLTAIRLHRLYITRSCRDLERLSSELLGLHSWYFNNVKYSAQLRGADTANWENRLVKTWTIRNTLHAVPYTDLPMYLGTKDRPAWLARQYGEQFIADLEEEVLALMEDGVTSRAELRRIFWNRLDARELDEVFSPWGGIMVTLAVKGKVAFRSVSSREFDLIDTPIMPHEDALAELTARYFAAYGPAQLSDAAFSGIPQKELKEKYLKNLKDVTLDGKTYWYSGELDTGAGIPEVALLAGFDPVLNGYRDRSPILPEEYAKIVVNKAGVMSPSIMVNGRVAGVWSVKKGVAAARFFKPQTKKIKNAAEELSERLLNIPMQFSE